MIYVICGPTASGKTKAAINLANLLSCPIINADAFQIYKEMNVGTAKISKEDKDYSRHYLLDIISPEETYSVKQYQTDFRKVLNNLLKSNENIIVCGGTGLYIRASFYDYSFSEDQDDVSDLEALSNEELYEMLKKVDPKACETIHMNNKKRVIRALSIARTHSSTKSEEIDMQEHKLIYDNVKFIMISPDREKLYENINLRVDEMISNGLVDEVKSLKEKYTLSTTAKAAIGYKEILSYLDNEMTLDDAVELIKQRSRNYAKRQVTFFKHQLPCEVFESAVEFLKEFVNE